MIRFFLLFTACVWTTFLSGQQVIPIDSISTYIGQHVKICDKVADAFRPKGDNKITYLNFGGKYPDHTFSAIIFPKDQPKFPYNPVEVLKEKNICITGQITEYKGKPQMVLNDPSQVEIKE
jgi:hypothetical protein